MKSTRASFGRFEINRSLIKYSRTLLAFALCAWVTVASPAQAGNGPHNLLNKEHMLLVQGRPRFILGLYENPKDDVVLKEAVAAGFNLIQCSADPAALDRVQKYGAMAWVNVGDSVDFSSDAATRRQHLAELVQRVGTHPALLIWEGPDEILWNNWWGTTEQIGPELNAMQTMAQTNASLQTLSRQVRDLYDRGLYSEFEKTRAQFWQAAGMPASKGAYRIDDAPERVAKTGLGITAGIRALRALDPRHVIWLNHAPRNSLADLQLYNQAVDMAGCDIYPVPPNRAVGHSDLLDKGLTSVGAYTDRMRRAAPGKACAMVLQGFGWRDLQKNPTESERAVGIGRRPTWAETRFMAYDCILHGANALLYWGTAYLKPGEDGAASADSRPPFWHDLLRVTRELHALEPALVAPPLKTPALRRAPTYGSIDSAGIVCTLRRVENEFVLLVANETEAGLHFTLADLPASLNGRTLFRLYSTEEHSIARGQLEDGIKPFFVHVYATSRSFEDPSLLTETVR